MILDVQRRKVAGTVLIALNILGLKDTEFFASGSAIDLSCSLPVVEEVDLEVPNVSLTDKAKSITNNNSPNKGNLLDF